MKLKIPEAIRWSGDDLFLLDQTRLPLEVVEEKQETIQQVWDSIKQLKVRGAPAIGISAAYGLLIGIRDSLDQPFDVFIKRVEEQAAYLDGARPTAVNLHWAMTRMVNVSRRSGITATKELYALLEKEAKAIDSEDKFLCQKLGEIGGALIKPGMGVLTHCNAGAIATSGLGTALAAMYVAAEKGVPFKVFADETRPLLQGARLTSWELQQAGIDVTLITDNMAGHLMSKGLIDMVIVGTDRVAANGDVANKIGTMSVAILANYFNIPFYVSCPSSTIDFKTASGDDIEIEERNGEEVTSFGNKRTAPEGIQTRNPAFDVTPNRLVTGLITEKGIVTAPYKENLIKMFPNHQSV
ncbi:S-methyl-5-thioribose-1-phosphate isomerase [bacterium]|nr:S-methyl-5-thioribose-1-phosphate isomerase [bacterium]